jgi:hypothetical protein
MAKSGVRLDAHETDQPDASGRGARSTMRARSRGLSVDGVVVVAAATAEVSMEGSSSEKR